MLFPRSQRDTDAFYFAQLDLTRCRAVGAVGASQHRNKPQFFLFPILRVISQVSVTSAGRRRLLIKKHGKYIRHFKAKMADKPFGILRQIHVWSD